MLVMLVMLMGCGDATTYNPLQTKVKAFEQEHKILKKYNSFIEINIENSLEQAKKYDASPIKGKLYGMTFGVKDNISAVPFKTRSGSLAFDYSPEKSSSVVERIMDEGGLILGKTNMHELAFGITSINYAYGTVHNAVEYDYIAGGSSGGSASAVALGLVTASLGSDTGGSGRIPAAFNGIFGYRPTTGRYPNDGVILLSETKDTISLMAKSIKDIAIIDQVIMDNQEKVNWLQPKDLQNITMGIPKEFFYENISEEVSKNINLAIAILKRLNVTAVEKPLKSVGELNAGLSFPIVLHESSKLFQPQLEKYGAEGVTTSAEFLSMVKSPDVRQLFETAIIPNSITEAEYLQAKNNDRKQLIELFNDYFKQNELDILVIPVTPDPAVLIEQVGENTFSTMIRNVDVISSAGLPAITIPFGETENGIPLGIELVANTGEDVKLLAIAELIHHALHSAQE